METAGGLSESPTSSASATAPGVPTPHPLSKDVLGFDEDDDEDLEVFSKDASFTDASSFSISMPTSPASMINQHTLEDETDSKDLFVTVDDPENHVTTIETFVTYRITTKTTRGEFDSCEYVVRRRYQDFLWLKGKLEEAHSTLIIPPLPEKFVMRGMVERFNKDFVETRRKALHKFLNRIADHPTLSFNEDFKVFLTAQAWELASHKKLDPGFIVKMGETVRAVAGTVRSVKNRPDEFRAMNEYVDIFRQKLGTLDKISHRILKEQKEYLAELKEYGPIYTLWSGSDEELVEPLQGVASCIENCCKTSEGLVVNMSEGLLPVLHEYVLCAETLKSVLKRRDLIQAEYESRIDAIDSKKADKEMLSYSDLSFTFGAFLGKNTEEIKQQKQQKLDHEIEELQLEIGKYEDKVECANSNLKADWERWNLNMQSDLRSAFHGLAENNICYYERCLATWESFLASQQNEINTEKDVKDST
ncbi:sorting nexin-7 isoform X1 [Callorhinchus milii]|uniref:Sorting nexin-7 n=1 Tax=Callorhinchus milii TaxID=7868 RepID=V9KCV5_CALMI|nr:sorting nexin-7 isoform X1 [Callorhinchus milii]XP_042191221.1 sorting nexin-7 isoform X1 [Callorhinchus milii]